MREITDEERAVLNAMSQGASDMAVCREFGLIPEELAALLERVRLANPDPQCDNSLYERAMRRRSENTARSLEARFNALLEASSDAILVVNALNGEIRQANQNAARLFGYPPSDLVGLSVEKLVPERYRAIHPAFRIGFLSSVRKREMGYHPPIFAATKQGEEIEIAIALTATLSDEEVMVVCTEFARWSHPDASETDARNVL